MTAAEVIESALTEVRRLFYADMQKFAQDREFLVRVLTVPAKWLHERGASMPASWHARILGLILADAKAHQAGPARFFPGWLLKVVQEHMQHQGDRYYQAAKGTRHLAGKVVRGVSRETQAVAEDATRLLVEAHRIASRKVQGQRTTGSRETQKELF